MSAGIDRARWSSRNLGVRFVVARNRLGRQVRFVVGTLCMVTRTFNFGLVLVLISFLKWVWLVLSGQLLPPFLAAYEFATVFHEFGVVGKFSFQFFFKTLYFIFERSTGVVIWT
jgi:hypothetical protein